MDLPKRKRIRLKGYDYSQNGAYFITACTKERHEILWNVGATFGRPQELPQLSKYGTIIKNEIDRIGEIYDNVVAIDNVGATFGRPQGLPQLSKYGTIVKNEIDRIGEIYNHVVATDNVGATFGRPQELPQLSKYGAIIKNEIDR